MDGSSTEQPVTTAVTPTKKEFLNDGKESDGAGSSTSGRASPDPNCPICLGKLENKSFADSCLHQFCFTCLLEWSKVKAECPLCKQSFKSIYHNIRTPADYETYYVRSSTATTEANNLLNIFASLEQATGREPFRYRTTAASSYLDYFVRLEASISQHVIPPMPPLPTITAGSHWRRRRQRGTSDFRRNIYQQGLWVQRTRDITGRVRDCSPEFYRANPALVHRLVPWLNRELNVLCSSNDQQVQHVISRILDLITQVPIRSTGFSSAIAPYIGRHTEHFVHEFYCFATSPYDLVGYDRYTLYVNHDSIAHQHLTDVSDDSSDSDVQIVGSYTPVVPAVPVVSDNSSDECVVVDSIPAPQPEVITIESDNDDVVQVNIHIGPENSQPGPSTSRRPRLNRGWLRLQNVPSSDPPNNVNVSINIARGRRTSSASSSHSSSSQSSDSWSPHDTWKRPAKLRLKEKYKKQNAKGKSLPKPKSKKLKKSRREASSSQVVTRKRRPSKVLKKDDSSSEDDKNNWQIVTDPESSNAKSGSETETKPRLRSIVIKNVKPEPSGDVSPPLSLSPSHSDIDWINSISASQECEVDQSSDFEKIDVLKSGSSSYESDRTSSNHSKELDPYAPSCSYQSNSYASSSSDHLSSRKRKYSRIKKRDKKESH